jgi:peptidoglycan-associated lipoprotein
MKSRLWLVLALLCLLTACATQQKQGAAVEDHSTTSGAAAPAGGEGGAQTYGAGEEKGGGFSELNKPGSLLATRVIYFDFDSSEIKPEYRKLVEAHAEYLAKHPDVTITLEGNTDERGSREYNLALGERRAKAVKQQMTLLGADPDQIHVTSYGEERPAVQGHNENAWSKNRRVVIDY